MSGAFAAVSGRAGRDGERRTSGAGRAFVLSASVTAGWLCQSCSSVFALAVSRHDGV